MEITILNGAYYVFLTFQPLISRAWFDISSSHALRGSRFMVAGWRGTAPQRPSESIKWQLFWSNGAIAQLRLSLRETGTPAISSVSIPAIWDKYLALLWKTSSLLDNVASMTKPSRLPTSPHVIKKSGVNSNWLELHRQPVMAIVACEMRGSIQSVNSDLPLVISICPPRNSGPTMSVILTQPSRSNPQMICKRTIFGTKRECQPPSRVAPAILQAAIRAIHWGWATRQKFSSNAASLEFSDRATVADCSNTGQPRQGHVWQIPTFWVERVEFQSRWRGFSKSANRRLHSQFHQQKRLKLRWKESRRLLLMWWLICKQVVKLFPCHWQRKTTAENSVFASRRLFIAILLWWRLSKV